MFQGHPNSSYGKYHHLQSFEGKRVVAALVFGLTVICHQNVNNNNSVERLAVIFRHFPALNNNKH